MDDVMLERLAALAGRDLGGLASDLAELAPLLEALALRDESSGAVDVLARGFSATLDEATAQALTEGAGSAAEVYARLTRLRALLAAHDATGQARRA